MMGVTQIIMMTFFCICIFSIECICARENLARDSKLRIGVRHRPEVCGVSRCTLKYWNNLYSPPPPSPSRTVFKHCLRRTNVGDKLSIHYSGRLKINYMYNIYLGTKITIT